MGNKFALPKADSCVPANDPPYVPRRGRDHDAFCVAIGMVRGLGSRGQQGTGSLLTLDEVSIRAIMGFLAVMSCSLTLEGHEGNVYCCCFSPDGRFILSCSMDKYLRVWDARSGACFMAWDAHADGINDCCFSRDGKMVVSAANDKKVKVWNWDEKKGSKLRNTMDGHTREVTSVCYAPGGNTILSGARDGNLILWNAATGEIQRIMEEYSSHYCSCCFSPDGQSILCSNANTMQLWETGSGHLQKTFDCNATVFCCSYSPDGRYVLSGCVSTPFQGNLKCFDVASGQLQVDLSHSTGGSIYSCCFTPDSRRILSASSDSLLKLWSVETGQLQGTLRGHTNGVSSCTFSPLHEKGYKAIVSSSWDKTVKVWPL